MKFAGLNLKDSLNNKYNFDDEKDKDLVKDKIKKNFIEEKDQKPFNSIFGSFNKLNLNNKTFSNNNNNNIISNINNQNNQNFFGNINYSNNNSNSKNIFSLINLVLI